MDYPQELDIVLTNDKVNKASSYNDTRSCPLAEEFRRIFPEEVIVSGASFVDVGEKYYCLITPFTFERYMALKMGSIKEFKTKATLS